MKSKLYICITLLSLAAIASAQEKPPSEQDCLSILQSNAAVQQKARACQQLSIVGTGQSVDILARLLDDEQLSDYARFALEQIDDSRVDEAFRSALGRLKGRRLAGVISSVGARCDVKAVALMEKIVRDRQSGASDEAVAALGRIASDDAVKIIAKVLVDGPEDLRTASAEACLAAGQRLMSRNQNQTAIALFNRIITANVADHLKSAAVYNTIIARGEAGLPLLTEQLKSKGANMVETALLAVRKLPGNKVSQSLAAELPGLDPVVQVLVIKALLDRDDPSVVGVIQKLAESDNINVRMEALKALGQIGDSSSVTVLVKAAGSSGSESEIALAGLRSIQAEDIEQRIVQAVKAARDPLKAELIDIIAVRQFKSAVPVLIEVASSKNGAVAIASFKALSELAGPQYLHAIAALLTDISSDRIRSQAEITVAAIALKKPDTSGQADEVIHELGSAGNAEARLSFLRVLGKIGNDLALAVLQESLGSDNESVRDVAIRALAACPNTNALEALLKISNTADNDVHRILALRGYIRLLGMDEDISAETKAGLYAKVMSRATATADKKLVLAGLAGVSHPEALKLIAGYIDDASVRDEAILASLSTAQLTAGAAPDMARGAALKTSKIATSPDIKARATALVKAIDGFADFIVSWKVSGFYTEAHRDHNTLLWMTFEPETPNTKAVWSLMPAGTDPDRPWILDLLKLYPGDNRVAYAKTWIHSEESQDGILQLGSDDGIKAWLNGQLIHDHSIARAAVPDSDQVKVSLKQGWNLLMLKISQNNGPWEFCARIPDAKGITIDCFHDEPSGGKQAVSIFDGKTFAGWEGNLHVFRTEDGAIAGGTLKGNIERNEFLCTKTEYGDFELRLKVKLLGANANAGIQIRSRRIPNHYEMSGYQADMGQQYWGCLYDESRRNKVLAGPDRTAIEKVLKAGEWNDYMIRCQGKRIQLWINGFQTVDYTEEEDAIEQTGLIGLQIHVGGPSEAWYRDIVISEF
jgi:HEAT repeat protein